MRFLCIIALTIVYSVSHAQLDSILDQGTYRTFIIHLPAGYNENTDYPLVLNLHGLGSSAFEQQLYSQFDAIADEEQFIVAYVNAINNNWDLFGASDVNFLSNLVDTLRNQYSTNNCLFSMGMSQGGFLSYKLACELDHSLAGIAVVTGNMLEAWQNTCSAPGVSVMHFHGTADQVVNYNGSFGISPVEETVAWWADENNCDEVVVTFLPNTNTTDDSTVEEYRYNGCDNGSEVFLYKVINGGHTWPGAFPIQSLGNTNQDIDASEIIGNFFRVQCDAITNIHRPESESFINIYPNPAQKSFTVEWPRMNFDLAIFDMMGVKVLQTEVHSGYNVITCSEFGVGIYFVQLVSTNGDRALKKIIIVN